MAAVMWRGYLRFLEKFPLITMASTTGTLMATGDGICQILVEGKKPAEYDAYRSGRFFVMGFFVVGPMMRGWYLSLDRMFAGSNKAALKMVMCDQLCAAPVFVTVILSGLSVLKMENSDIIKAKLERDLWPVLKTNWKIWPAVQFINFFFLPLQHRVLFVNFVALFWNTYLAYVCEQE